ncbi:MAG: preprotein translocase subunit SecE [Phycisphaerales bacterium]|nr:preprotein translocase subunit SecE [Phycisphaerales bacterium]
MIYWLIAVRPASVDFLIATDSEVKKVNWSTRKDIKGSTFVVIGATFILAVFLFAIDVVFKSIFQAIDILAK